MKPRLQALRALPAIVSSPDIRDGEPILLGVGVPVSALLDRIDAGDSVEEVAKDFSCDPGSLELLLELRGVLFERAAAQLIEDAEEMTDVAQNAADEGVRQFESGRIRGHREAAGYLRYEAHHGEKA